MKRTLLIATMLAAPMLALANDKSAAVSAENATPAQIVAKLHHKTRMHVELGDLAQAQGGSAKVKDLGTQMVKDYSKLDQSVVRYAADNSYPLTASLEPMHESAALGSMPTPEKRDLSQAQFDKLKGLKGTAFDREFLSTVCEGSERAIKYFEAARVNQQDSKLKGLIDDAVMTFKNKDKDAEKLLSAMPTT